MQSHQVKINICHYILIHWTVSVSESHTVGSHQATLKELSRVRHELLKTKADSKSLVQQEKPEKDCTKTLLSYQVAAEPQDKGKEKHVLQQSEKSVSEITVRELSNHCKFECKMLFYWLSVHSSS